MMLQQKTAAFPDTQVSVAAQNVISITRSEGKQVDDILSEANVGDVLKCVHSTLPETAFFTIGSTYTVVKNDWDGKPTIRDNRNRLVPPVGNGRRSLPAFFTFESRVLEAEPAKPSLSSEELNEMKNMAVFGVNQHILHTRKAITDRQDEIESINLKSEGAKAFYALCEEDKGELLRAVMEKRRFQQLNALGVWQDLPDDAVIATGSMNTYRVRPMRLSVLEVEIQTREDRIKRLIDQRAKFLGWSEEW